MSEFIDTRTRVWAAIAVVAGIALFIALDLIEEPDGRAALSAFFLEDLLAPIEGLSDDAKG